MRPARARATAGARRTPARADAYDKPGVLSLVARDDGSKQWAYRGRPLYRWKLDHKPGDAGGDGSAACGTSRVRDDGRWVVRRHPDELRIGSAGVVAASHALCACADVTGLGRRSRAGHARACAEPPAARRRQPARMAADAAAAPLHRPVARAARDRGRRCDGAVADDGRTGRRNRRAGAARRSARCTGCRSNSARCCCWSRSRN